MRLENETRFENKVKNLEEEISVSKTEMRNLLKIASDEKEKVEEMMKRLYQVVDDYSDY